MIGVLTAVLGVVACRHTDDPAATKDPDPPSGDEERERTMRCIALGEALYGATAPRQVIARSSRSLRMSADDESLATLLACLSRGTLLEEAGSAWPEPVVRSLANAYGAALLTSAFTFADLDERLMRHDLRRDVTLFWRARLLPLPPERQEALLREALEENPRFTAASLALASVLVEEGRAEEAAVIVEPVPPHDRPDLRAFILGAAAAARGDRHQASALLEQVARVEMATAPDGPDALALRLLPTPPPSPLLCELGFAHQQAGERQDALRAFRAGECFAALTRLYLDEGDTFSALVTSSWAPDEERERASEAAGAHHSLRARLESKLKACAAFEGGARCDEHRQRLDSLLPAPSSAQRALEARIAAPAPSVWQDEVTGQPVTEDDVVLHPAHAALLEDEECPAFTSVARASSAGRTFVLGLVPRVPGACDPEAAAYGLVVEESDGARRGPFEIDLPLSAQLLTPASGALSLDDAGMLTVRGWREAPRGGVDWRAAPLEAVSLRAPLSSLLSDSDGDSLTDLQERWLATDPQDTDSDDDGTDDDADMLPLAAGASEDEDEILRRALGALFYDDDHALLDGRKERTGPTLLVGVPRALFRAREGVRVIELVGDAADIGRRSGAGRGATLLDVSEMVIEKSGTRALVTASRVDHVPLAPSSWGAPPGGHALVEKTAQGWRARRLTREMALSLGER